MYILMLVLKSSLVWIFRTTCKESPWAIMFVNLMFLHKDIGYWLSLSWLQVTTRYVWCSLVGGPKAWLKSFPRKLHFIPTPAVSLFSHFPSPFSTFHWLLFSFGAILLHNFCVSYFLHFVKFLSTFSHFSTIF